MLVLFLTLLNDVLLLYAYYMVGNLSAIKVAVKVLFLVSAKCRKVDAQISND